MCFDGRTSKGGPGTGRGPYVTHVTWLTRRAAAMMPTTGNYIVYLPYPLPGFGLCWAGESVPARISKSGPFDRRGDNAQNTRAATA